MWSKPAHYIATAVALAFIGIVAILAALQSENWIEYQVNRREILNAFNREPELNIRLKDAFNKNPTYFTRTQGIFYTCFPEVLPSESGTFTKWFFQSHCLWSPNYFPSESTQEQFTQNQSYHLWLVRGTGLLFALGLVATFLCLIIVVAAHCNESTRLLGWGIVFALLAVLLCAGAIGCWHGAQQFESNVLEMAPYYRSWEPVLKSTTRSWHAWAYVAAWFGVGFLAASALFIMFALRSMKKMHERELCAKQGYIMPNFFDKSAAMVPYSYNTYGGYGGYPPYTYNQYSNGYYGYMTYGR